MNLEGASTRTVAHRRPNDLDPQARAEIGEALNLMLADIFALYVKTKNFHWHVSGPHFRDYHLLLDRQAEQLYDKIDATAERVRKLGTATLRSTGQIARMQRISDNERARVSPSEMLTELRDDNGQLASVMREIHASCQGHGDVATAGLLETWIDECDERIWVLLEANLVDVP
jgi:starvation-inducible DNA-binding protein